MLVQLLTEQNISTVFQPIFDLANSCILGYEALSRGPKGHPLEFPNQLFLAAEQQGKVSELELLCRKKAIENFALLGLSGKLFLNVSPRTLLDPKHPKGETQHLLEQHGLSAAQVVIEVTEQDEVPNHQLLQQTLAYYRELGFSIAIDDLGAGHSGLRKWSELQPDIIKIDKYFIDHCHQSIVKKEFLKSIIDLAKATNTQVIAEGIEHQEELDLLTGLGVSLAQGFLLERPSIEPSRLFSSDLLAKQALKQQNSPELDDQTIGLLVETQQAIFASTHCAAAQTCFEKNKGLISLAVLNEQQQPVGMLHRDQLAELFAAPYGHALYDKKSVTRVMDTQPLIVDKLDTLDMVSQQITDFDFDIRRHILVTEHQTYLGVVPLRKILKHITDQKVRHAQHANPLTMLPGNVAITEAIELRLRRQQNFFLAYVDLNHFKQFNDLYGYASGDAVIKLLADVISDSCDPANSFVGHIGGDDFMVIFDGTDAWHTCQLIIKEFERRSQSFFTPEHIAAGGYWAPNREGQEQFVPLLTLSIGLVNPDLAFCENSHQVSALATDAKKEAKRYRQSYLFLCHRRKPATPIVRMRLASGAD
ncbi:GGDEF domain-containing protein [Pseudoalteromonas tunicata]|nr:GGDEF domain-containing protein [Pseudoalteromonas tunicata]